MRIIGHLDMDAFFAAIEERDNPRLQGKPLVVGADPKGGKGRGVVSTANYKAREYGIRSALPISTAWRLSEAARSKGLPPVVFLGVDIERYAEVSEQLMAILRKHAAHIEEASIDEAYFDLSFTGSYEQATIVCKTIKRKIKEQTKLTGSVGVGPNKLIAKIASDRQKPDGLTVVLEENAEIFLEPLPIRTIPGVGPKTEKRFHEMGIRTVKDAKNLSQEALNTMMGKWGLELYEKLRARDNSPLVEQWEPKSIGEQETFERDTLDPVFLRKRLRFLSEEVHKRFLRSGFKGFRTVTITVRFEDFVTRTRSKTLKVPGATLKTLHFEALKLFMPFLDRREENPQQKFIRLLGVRIEKLASNKQPVSS
jgi:DNA polymerase IV (DinB-like DNA polymerase)